MHPSFGFAEFEGHSCESGAFCFVLMEAVKSELGFQAERAELVRGERDST